MWLRVEATVMIIAACIPTLGPFFQHVSSKQRKHSEFLELGGGSARSPRYGTDTYAVGGNKDADSMETKILSPETIRMTSDVLVTREGEYRVKG